MFINYCPHSNLKLWVEYGFTASSNSHEVVPVFIPDVEKVVNSTIRVEKVPGLPGKLEELLFFDDTGYCSWMLDRLVSCCLLPGGLAAYSAYLNRLDLTMVVDAVDRKEALAKLRCMKLQSILSDKKTMIGGVLATGLTIIDSWLKLLQQ